MNKFFKEIDDLKLHPIGIGTWMIGGGWNVETKSAFADSTNDEKEVDAIKYSISKGQNHIDGAELYSAGHTDELIGIAAKDFDRSKLFIASKIHRLHAHKKDLIPATKEILRKMQTDYLDLLYIHAPFPEIPMEEYISGLNEAIDLGLAKNIAVSNFSVDQLKQAMDLSKHPIRANQIRYNALYKKDGTPELLEFCKENNILIVAYRPVERKLLADETSDQTILEISRKYGKTPAQIAINWLVMQENVVAIPKAVSKDHIDENLGAMDFELEQEDAEKINNIESID
jgi:diketogulonate reductase-like aldo/keto reductase